MNSNKRSGSTSTTYSEMSEEETREGVEKKVKIPATVPKPFNFALDSRLKQRRDFNEDLKKRQRAAEERDRIAQEQREREEAQELKKYRKTLDFKAKPIQTYSGIYPSPSERMLTVPQGPRLHTESRCRGSDDLPRADSRGSMRSDYSDVQPVVYSAYSYNGPTVL